VTSTGESRIARGQCLQHYGAGEPYLPVLEAQQGLGGGHAEDGQLQLRVLSSPRFHELQDPA
jgi:hypothetical protein